MCRFVYEYWCSGFCDLDVYMYKCMCVRVYVCVMCMCMCACVCVCVYACVRVSELPVENFFDVFGDGFANHSERQII